MKKVFPIIFCLLYMFINSTAQIRPVVNPAVQHIRRTATDIIRQQFINEATKFDLGNPVPANVQPWSITGGSLMTFEKGKVYQSVNTGFHAVPTKFDFFQVTGFPLTDEMEDGLNRVQVFQKMTLYYITSANIVRQFKFQNNAYTTLYPPEMPVKEAYFKIYLLGITCNKATNDDVLERDGKGDEVYILSSFYDVDKNNHSTFHLSCRTRVLGDVNNVDWLTGPNLRIKCGSKSNLGGIADGDSYPNNPPYEMRNTPLTPNRNGLITQFPATIYEGYITDDSTKILLMPTIWEKDNDPDILNSFLSIFTTGPLVGDINRLLGQIKTGLDPHINTGTATQYFGNIFYSLDGDNNVFRSVEVNKNIFGDPHDRPIGMYDAGGSYRFKPTVMRLGYAEALQLANMDALGVGINGVFKIDYVDDPALRGNYTLYFRIEKMNGN